MRPLLLLLCAACSTPGVVRVTAAPAEPGVYVRFRRPRLRRAEHPARVEWEGGRIGEVFHSPDRLTTCVHWIEPGGTLRCAFPYGGEAVLRPGERVVEGEIEYVFLEEPGISVTSHLPRGCPMVSSVELDILLDEEHLPAVLVLPRDEPASLVATRSRVRFALPRDEEDALVGGDYAFGVRGAQGGSWHFWITVDPDGTLSAGAGFLRNW